MLWQEAEKIKTKYQFLIGHKFRISGTEIEVEDICIWELYNAYGEGCEVYVVYKGTEGTRTFDKLSDFLRSAGTSFWVKYFDHLRKGLLPNIALAE
jgi:hypothetical protein